MTGLEALKRLFIKIKHYDSLDEKVMLENDYSIIEKELKALEIIKRIVKIVDYSDHTIANGNLVILQGGEIKIKEELDLLKEVLK